MHRSEAILLSLVAFALFLCRSAHAQCTSVSLSDTCEELRISSPASHFGHSMSQPESNKSPSLSCPDGTVISSITSAFWGNDAGCSLGDIQQRLSSRAVGLSSFISNTWPVTSPNGQDGGRGQMWLLDPCYGYQKFFNASWCCDSPSRVLESDAAVGAATILVGTSGKAGSSGDKGLAQSATVTSPSALAVDTRNILFIVEAGGWKLRAVSPGGLKGERSISTISGFTGPGSDDGTLTKSQFKAINALSFRPTTNAMLLADNDRIRRIDSPSPDNIEWHGFDDGLTSNASTVAGPSTQLDSPFPPSLVSVTAIAEYNGSLFIADQGTNSIYKLPLPVDNTTHLILSLLPFEIVASVNSPSSLAIDPLTGDIFITDSGNNVISKISAATGLSSLVAGNATVQTLCDPQGLTFQRTAEGGTALFFADSCSGRVMKIDLTTGVLVTVLRSTPDRSKSVV